MGYCFEEKWDIIIRGDAEAVSKISYYASLAKKSVYEMSYNNPIKACEELEKQIFHKTIEALESPNELKTIRLHYVGLDGEHNICNVFMNYIGEGIPELEIALVIIVPDDEFGESPTVTRVYSASGDAYYPVNAWDDHNDIFPCEKWIPKYFSLIGMDLPGTATSGKIIRIGRWTDEEKMLLEDALIGDDSIMSIPYIFNPVWDAKPFTKIDYGFEFNLCGDYDFDKFFDIIDDALQPYIKAGHKKQYKKLARLMHEKRLFLGISDQMDICGSGEATCIKFIYSDGKKLKSYSNGKFYSFTTGLSAITPAEIIETVISYKSDEWLDSLTTLKFMLLLQDYAMTHEKLPELPAGMNGHFEHSNGRSNDGSKESYDGIDFDDFYAEYLSDMDGSEYDGFYDAAEILWPYIIKNKGDLHRLLSKARKKVSEPEKFTPGCSDSRFDNKRFFISGYFKIYSKSEIKQIIKSFGGTVSSKLTNKTDYIVIGNGAGKSLYEAIRLGIAIIPEDYLSEYFSNK